MTSKVHTSTLIVLASGLAITLVLAIGAQVTNSNITNRALHSQLHQATAGLQSSLPGLQDPLTAAEGIAASVGTSSFRIFARSLVGPKAPFRSVSVWSVGHGAPRALAIVGKPPELPRAAGGTARFLDSVKAGPTLAIAGLLATPVRALGLAVRERGDGSRFIVYAESALPSSPRTHFTASSPYAGLNVALFLGTAPTRQDLIETSTSIGASGPTARTVVPFGDTSVTIVAVLESAPAGSLPSGLPWMIGGAGLLVSLAAAVTSERLVRRRELAVRVATDQEDRYTTQRGIAQTLQHSLLPERQPRHAGTQIAARYVAGAEQLDVGGDWYDVVDIDEDHLFVTVGDVSGRGLAAATVMGSLRPAIRAYAVQRDEPATVLRKLGGLVEVRRDNCFATVLCASIDLDRATVTIASAGHPPPLLVASGARFLATPIAPPVGVANGSGVSSTTYTFPMGSTMVVFTDGLVERRGRQLDQGLEQLRKTAEAHVGTVESMLDALLDTLVGSNDRDDVAVIAVRSLRPGVAGTSWRQPIGGGTVTSRTFPCDAHSVRASRDFVEATLGWDHGGVADDESRSAVSLAVSELVTNAVVHARTELDVCVVASSPGRDVRVGVTDTGGGSPALLSPSTSSSRGRGIRIVDTLSTAWGIEWHADRRAKTVWFEYRPGAAVAAGREAAQSLARTVEQPTRPS